MLAPTFGMIRKLVKPGQLGVARNDLALTGADARGEVRLPR